MKLPRQGRMRAAFVMLIAFVLQSIPLPTALDVVRPPLLVLAVVYWSLRAPGVGGIGVGFLSGLALDIYRGALFGQYALATTLVAYIGVRQHLLIRNQTPFQQGLFVFASLVVWEFVVWLIDGWTGQPTGNWSRWLPVLSGTVAWPLVAWLLERGDTHAHR
jgi:rod shape-determining protein MreD